MKKNELTNEEIVEILKKSIESVKRCPSYPTYLCIDLDALISNKLELRKSINVTDYIPLFTYANALKHANADKLDKRKTVTNIDNVTPYVWWHSRNNPVEVCNANRIIFLEWLIEQYSK